MEAAVSSPASRRRRVRRQVLGCAARGAAEGVRAVEPRTCSSGSRRRTTPSSTSSTTSAQSSSRSTSSRRSSTTSTVRRDRGDERTQRRLRDGRDAAVALSIAAFPEELPIEVLGAVFAAAAEQVRAAAASLAGGHTIRDPEPKYGLAVVGMVHPNGICRRAAAARRRALPDEAARDRPRARGRGKELVASRVHGGDRLDDDAQRRRGGGVAAFAPTPSPTSPASACSATPTRWRSGAASASASSPTGCPRSKAPSSRPSGRATGGDPRNRDFAGPSRVRRRARRAGRARLRRADLRRLARLAARGEGPPSRRSSPPAGSSCAASAASGKARESTFGSRASAGALARVLGYAGPLGCWRLVLLRARACFACTLAWVRPPAKPGLRPVLASGLGECVRRRLSEG